MRLGSLFSGIGGIDLAFERAGFTVAWQVEIDKQARSVLARHWPDVPRFEDVREVGKKQLSKVDVIAGGFPCQDLSVAGKRGGIVGERSGLYFEMVRIVHELRPRFFVWENVPGLLSSYTAVNPPPDNPAAMGRGSASCERWDLEERSCFEAVLAALHRIGFSGCWRSLDAQFFGVPQRRERVFGVFARGRSGAERCAEILSLTNGVPGHSQASGATGQGVAATIRSRSSSRGVSAPGRGGEDDQNIVVAHTVRPQSKGAAWKGDGADNLIAGTLGGGSGERGWCDDLDRATFIPTTVGTLNPGAHPGSYNGQDAASGLLIAFNPQAGGSKAMIGGISDIVSALGCTQIPGIAHTLSSAGADASEDGTGRGTPIVCFDTTQITSPVSRANPKPGDPCHTLSSGMHAPAIAAVDYTNGIIGEDLCGTLEAAQSKGNRGHGVTGPQGVRRLTPRECERLQGLPDDWTRWDADGKEIKDGPRYRMIGNGVAEPVLRWIANRIKEAAPCT